MRVKLFMAAGIFLIVSMVLLYEVAQQWNFHFDAHGKYISPDGSVHWESQYETKFLILCASAISLIITAYFAFKRKAL